MHNLKNTNNNFLCKFKKIKFENKEKKRKKEMSARVDTILSNYIDLSMY